MVTHKIDNKIILCSSLIVNNDKILLLFRNDHKFYETPGGKLDSEDCKDLENIGLDDYKTAAIRELIEELGDKFLFEEPELFCQTEFQIPDGRTAIVYKFLTKIIAGKPEVKEPKLFDRMEWIEIAKLKEYDLSPDLNILADEIIEKLSTL